MFFSADQKYVIKEVTAAERKVLVRLLPGYLVSPISNLSGNKQVVLEVPWNSARLINQPVPLL